MILSNQPGVRVLQIPMITNSLRQSGRISMNISDNIMMFLLNYIDVLQTKLSQYKSTIYMCIYICIYTFKKDFQSFCFENVMSVEIILLAIVLITLFLAYHTILFLPFLFSHSYFFRKSVRINIYITIITS